MRMQAFSGWQLFQQELQEPTLKVGDPIIDKILHGGFRKGIIEISGESGSGKTSIGMQLLFQCCLNPEDGGLGAKAVYLSTEGRPDQGRYAQLLKQYGSKYGSIPFGERILMQNVHKLVFQTKSLFKLLPDQARLNNVKLIVLDSIATFYRSKTDFIQRAKEMNKTCQHLRRLSFEHNLIVVLINQISDVFPDDIQFRASHYGSVLSSQRRVKPALGLAWSNVVNLRIMLSRSTATHDIVGCDEEGKERYLRATDSAITRTLNIVFSPYMSRQWVNFEITDGGIKGIGQKDAAKRVQRKKEEQRHKELQGLDSQTINELFGSEVQPTWNESDNQQ